jgi:tetratricopeptide (TPR) repeat protein
MQSEVHSLLQQGNQSLNAGNFPNAKSLYLEVINQNPNESDAHFGLGWIAFKEKQVEEACQYLKKANEIQPLNKNYLRGLTELYIQTGQPQAAITLFQQYLKTEPTQADIYLNYANLLAQTKQTELAIEAFQQCIKLSPNERAPYMSLGQLFYHLMQYRDAQEIYLKALTLGLKSAGLYLNIAKLHIDFGELEKAKQILADAILQYPENLAFPYRLGSLDSTIYTPQFFNQLKHLEQQILSPDNQFYLNWLLSKYASMENNVNAEIKLLVEAHKIFKGMNKFSYDSEYYLKRLSAITPPSTSNLEAIPNIDPSELSPIFIVGIPRCGSTLIENIICSGPKHVLKGEESSVIFKAMNGNIQNGSDEFWPQLQNDVNEHYQQAHLLKDKLRFTDKSLENIFLIEFILALYPNAKIVYCERNPLASIISILKNNMVSLPWAHDVNEIFEYTDNCLTAIEKSTHKYPDKIYTINYEAFVLNQEEESKKLMSFCDLTWDKSCLSFNESKEIMSKTASHIQIRDKINQNSLYYYQNYTSLFEAYKQKYSWLS